VVRDDPDEPGRRVVSVARWGLLPPWARDARAGARMINARAETVSTSRAYRGPFESRRCLVPADGWYEWRRQPDGQGKQAYYLTLRSGDGLAFAGLWQPWGRDRLLTTTVLTTSAQGDLATIHERMPLVLPAERWAQWLCATAAEVADLVESPPTGWVGDIEIRPVGPAIGNVRNNSPALIESVTDVQLSVNTPDPVDLRLF
jgi:putative SOS response-associated peptidase YedK